MSNYNKYKTQTNVPEPAQSYPKDEVANAQYREFFGPGEFRFAIYPSHWKDAWGKVPLLGIVAADDEFLAEKLAYDRGILPTPFNCTFQPKIKNIGLNRKNGSN